MHSLRNITCSFFSTPHGCNPLMFYPSSTYTVESRKIEVLRTRGFTSNYQLLSPRFFKKAKGILLSPPSVRPSVVLSPPWDEIQPNLVCEFLT